MFGSTRSSREGKPSAAGSLHVQDGIVNNTSASPETFRSFIALGDSFTEGLNDELRADGRHRGWADRVAQGLLVRQGLDEITYANLAIRGRLIGQVREEQVPVAERMRPDLVTFAAGVNDALRKGFDLDLVATHLEDSVRLLRAAGSQVLLFAYGDPARRSRSLARLSERMLSLRTATLAIAQAYECPVVDFWGVATYDDERLWSADRLHLSPLGHRLTAEAVLEALGRGNPAWRTPVTGAERPGFAARRVEDARWFGAHAGPWIARRVRGVSSGAGIEPKDPILRTIHAR